ncbi:MAG: MoxR family ATPase [Lachnospira sp.]|nr:MoxR family ATPase [Lachnospira sp.]
MTLVKEILENVNKVVVGKKSVSRLILTAMLAEGHVLIEDVPGVGKTTFANAFANTFDCKYSRIQFTPDTMPGDVTGSSVYNYEKHEFEYVPGAIMGNIILADELNRTSPKTQASMLEAMEERQVTVDGKKYTLPSPFVVIATQNPISQKGTYYLPESQLDRFMFRLSIGYPQLSESVNIVKNQILGNTVRNLNNIVDCNQWKELIKNADKVFISDELIEYAALCIEETRKHDKVILGASPRALISWVRAAKSYAFIQERDYVIPDDLKDIAEEVLCHRIVLKQSTENSREIEKLVVSECLRKVKVPIGK